MLLPYYTKNCIEAGLDEAGRGCLAGPVVAAAVIWDSKKNNKNIRDSKKLSAKEREELAQEIKENAIDWAIATCSPEEIDQYNILAASILAMHKALDKLQTTPEALLVDGNRFKPYNFIPHHCIIKGDDKYLSIAAASILAKTHRDLVMENLSNEFPNYFWEKNKGYPTIEHRKSIALNGITEHHRKTFRGVKEFL